MSKGLALLGIGMMVALAGCAAESKEVDQVNRVIDLCVQTTAKVSALSDAIDQAIKKAKADQENKILLKEASDACDALKSYCKKEVQPEALKIQLMQASMTPTEKENLRDRFRSEVEAKIDRLNEKWLILNTKIKDLQALADEVAYQGSKDTVDTFVTKNFAEAREEYNSLNRQLR
jgi:hypothetical protein